MKKIFACPDVITLADHMISEIVKPENWKDPFSSPTVIFSDSKAEQWFKLYWIDAVKKFNNPIIMNLNFCRLEPFLLKEILKGKVSSSKNLLDADFLRDLIIAKLSSKVQGKYYFEALEDVQVSDYLLKDNTLNLINLFDFASTMAKLFIDYETTRGKTFATGWQKTLYDELLSDGIKIKKEEYRTLAEYFWESQKIQKTEQNKAEQAEEGNKTVFIFGFSGMGQLYRELLKKYAEKNTLYVYIQAWKADDTKTKLIEKLGKSSRENQKLWDEEPEWLEASNAGQILNKEKLHFAAAVNKVREIEWVHSNICRLFKEGKAENSRDIIVAAPDIKDYKLSIKQVFEQGDAYKSDFPEIPYSIVDDSSENSFVASAVNTFWDIASKGYLSRHDFFAIIRNKFVQLVRKISEDDVQAWLGWIDSMNIFRQHKDGSNFVDDWKTAKQRLLLSRLTDQSAIIENQTVLPFNDLNSGDDTSLNKFISVIDELEYFVGLKEKITLNLEDTEILQTHLSSFLMTEDEIPEEFSTEKASLKAVCNELGNQKLLFEAGNSCIYKKILMLSVSAVLGSNSIQNGNLFAKGISFVNFKANRILPAKYVFLIGFDSEVFPGTDLKNTLDLRTTIEPGDESVSEKNKTAFLGQIFAAQNEVFFSYINKDLQKDQDFFRSSVLNDLLYELCDKQEFSDFEKSIETKLTIDENRPWSELYTSREFRNKKNLQKIKGTKSDATAQKHYEVVPLFPDRVKISNLKKFLEEPFKFMAENRFSYDDDNSDEETVEFEPVDYDNLNRAIIRNDYIKQWIAAKAGGKQVNFKDFKESLKQKNKLPAGIFGDKALKAVIAEAQEICQFFESNKIETSTLAVDQKITCEGLEFHDASGRFADKRWTLSGETPVHNMEKVNKELVLPEAITFYELKDVKNDKSKFLSDYISALGLVAAMGTDDQTYHIIFKDARDFECPFDLTKAEAKKLLELIYEKAYLENFLEPKCVPVKKVFENSSYAKTKELVDELEGEFGSPWSYFSKADLFDKYHDLGYTPDSNFTHQFEAARDNIRQLIKYV